MKPIHKAFFLHELMLCVCPVSFYVQMKHHNFCMNMACHNEKLKYVFASFGVLQIFYHKFCIPLCILLYCALFCYEFSVFSLMGIVNHSFGSPRCSTRSQLNEHNSGTLFRHELAFKNVKYSQIEIENEQLSH